VCAPHAPEPAGPCWHRPETLNAPAHPSSADQPEISQAVLVHGTEEAGSEWPQSGRHHRRRRHETAESDLGLSAHRATRLNGRHGSRSSVTRRTVCHPFVERLIGTIRRECLDRTLFGTAADLELKLLEFPRYFNGHRTHAGLGGLAPEPRHRRGQRTSERQTVLLAAPLSWAVSDADRGMIRVRRQRDHVRTSRDVN